MIRSQAGPEVQSGTTVRLGVLVDGDRVPRYVNTLLAELAGRRGIELAAVIVHRSDRIKATGFSMRLLPDRPLLRCALFLIEAAEGLVLRLRSRMSHPLRAEPLRPQTDCIVNATPIPTGTDFHCGYSKTDLERLSRLSLDFVVVESEWIPALPVRGQLARHGATRMRFGDLPAVPVRQAGFKEVCRRDPCSRFSIMLLRPDGDTVLFEGAFHTCLSLVDNRNELIRKAYPYLGQAIADHFSQRGITAPAPPVAGPSASETCMDGLLTSGELFGSLWARIDMIRVGAINRVLRRKEHWRITWYEGDWTDVEDAQSCVVESPAGSFLADPFVAGREGRQICFAEEYRYKGRRGVISAIEITKNMSRMLGSVIEEPFHLSFPYVFEFESRLYMCPETAEAGQIRVYECVDYPMKWELRKVLMDRVRAVDTMLVEHQGRWWMFTNIDPQGLNDFESRLYLFWSDSPLSDQWEPHPQNPVVFNPLFGRNAGFLNRNGALFRCAQRQGFPQYGEGFSIREVTALTTERYAERLHLAVSPGAFEATGTHHIHCDDGLVVRDECHIIRPR